MKLKEHKWEPETHRHKLSESGLYRYRREHGLSSVCERGGGECECAWASCLCVHLLSACCGLMFVRGVTLQRCTRTQEHAGTIASPLVSHPKTQHSLIVWTNFMCPFSPCGCLESKNLSSGENQNPSPDRRWVCVYRWGAHTFCIFPSPPCNPQVPQTQQKSPQPELIFHMPEGTCLKRCERGSPRRTLLLIWLQLYAGAGG